MRNRLVLRLSSFSCTVHRKLRIIPSGTSVNTHLSRLASESRPVDPCRLSAGGALGPRAHLEGEGLTGGGMGP